MQNPKPWVRKIVTQHWCDCQISNKSYGIFKQWKNIPDIAMSSDTSIRQQPLNTKTCRSQKLQKQLEELSCRFCFEIQETVSHVLCGCLQIAQSLYKTKHDTLLRPVYHALLKINLDSKNLIIVLHGTYSLIVTPAKKAKMQRYYRTYHGNLKNVLRTVQTSQIS